MFGRQPRLPLDLILGLPQEEEYQGYSQYVGALRKRLQDSYQLASSEANKARKRQKTNYDTKVRGVVVEPGDRVLVEVLAFEGKHKIADKWEECPYVILDQPNEEVPVYVLEREDGIGPRKTLHRNHLLPISSLPIDHKRQRHEEPRGKRTARKGQHPKEIPVELESVSADDTSSDEEDFFLVLEDADDELVTENQSNEEETQDSVTVGDEDPGLDLDVPVEEDAGDEADAASDSDHDSDHEGDPDSVHGESLDNSPDEEAGEPEPEEAAKPEAEEAANEPEAEKAAKPEAEEAAKSPPRRSQRERKQAQRYQAGDYVLHGQVVDQNTKDICRAAPTQAPDWQQRAQFLASLANEDTLPIHVRENICRTMLNIVATTAEHAL